MFQALKERFLKKLRYVWPQSKVWAIVKLQETFSLVNVKVKDSSTGACKHEILQTSRVRLSRPYSFSVVTPVNTIICLSLQSKRGFGAKGILFGPHLRSVSLS